MGQAEGKVAPCLGGLPPPNRSLSAEDVREVEEPVIPIVAARDGEQIGARRRGARQRRSIGAETAVLIVRARGHRVHLVATHHQDGPPPCAMTAVATAQLEVVLSQQARHRVGRVPPVAEIGDVVEPHLGRLRPVVDVPARVHLEFTAVGVGGEQARGQDSGRRVEELIGVEPAHHRLGDEAKLGTRRRPPRVVVSRTSVCGAGARVLLSRQDSRLHPSGSSPSRSAPSCFWMSSATWRDGRDSTSATSR